MERVTLMLLSAALTVVVACDKQVNSVVTNENTPWWQDYVGQYPLSGSSTKPGFMLRPDVLEGIRSTLTPGVHEELSMLLVESPIEEPEKGFLLMHICEQHNCPHGADIVFAGDTAEIAVVLYRVDDTNAPATVTCYSNAYKTLGELPESVRKSLAATIIADVVPSLDVEKLPCE